MSEKSDPVAGHFVVAVGGGVASGKTAVTAAFERRGIACYDADIAARAVVARGQPALDEIVTRFGATVLHANGELDRAAMRRVVFADPLARKTLEHIVHPRVRAWLRQSVAEDRGAYCLLAIPLLVETWPAYAWVDRVLMVDVPPEMQLARLLQRDAVTEELARQMISAQATREQRLAIASDVIDNSGSLTDLDLAVAALHLRYAELAESARRSH